MSMGWKCPGCGRCYAPSVPECSRCGQPGETSTTYTIVTDRCSCALPLRLYDTGGMKCGHCGKPIDDPWGWPWRYTTSGSFTVPGSTTI